MATLTTFDTDRFQKDILIEISSVIKGLSGTTATDFNLMFSFPIATSF